MNLSYYIVRTLTETGLIRLFNFNITFKLNYRNFKIPFRGSKMGTEILGMGESWFLPIVNDLIPQNKKIENVCFVDVGMNIGQTLLKIKDSFPSIHFLGFEPNPICVSYLHELIKINNLENVNVLPVGVADQTGVLTLNADNEFASGASMIENFRKNQVIKFRYNCPVFNSELISNFHPSGLDVIKIDVEGFELNVIQGLLPMIKKYRPSIICEVLPNYGNQESDRFKRQVLLQELLASIDYSIFRINESSHTLYEINEFGIFHDMDQTNYVFKPTS